MDFIVVTPNSNNNNQRLIVVLCAIAVLDITNRLAAVVVTNNLWRW